MVMLLRSENRSFSLNALPALYDLQSTLNVHHSVLYDARRALSTITTTIYKGGANNVLRRAAIAQR